MMTNYQLYMLAHQSGQWYNAVLKQGKRFLDAFDATHGQFPWDDESHMFLAEKVFLITAINHAIRHLERLDYELKKRGDISFDHLLSLIASEEERKRIKEWRNMNEHDIDYLAGEGRNQKGFISVVEKNGHHFGIDAFSTFVHGGIGVFMIGNIEIDKLLLNFKENRKEILKKVEEVFDKAFDDDIKDREKE